MQAADRAERGGVRAIGGAMLAGMELRTGKVVGKHIVLDDTEGLEDDRDEPEGWSYQI